MQTDKTIPAEGSFAYHSHPPTLPSLPLTPSLSHLQPAPWGLGDTPVMRRAPGQTSEWSSETSTSFPGPSHPALTLELRTHTHTHIGLLLLALRQELISSYAVLPIAIHPFCHYIINQSTNHGCGKYAPLVRLAIVW